MTINHNAYYGNLPSRAHLYLGYLHYKNDKYDYLHVHFLIALEECVTLLRQ